MCSRSTVTAFVDAWNRMDWDAVVDTNLKGVFLVAQVAAPGDEGIHRPLRAIAVVHFDEELSLSQAVGGALQRLGDLIRHLLAVAKRNHHGIMAVQLNHTILAARDTDASATCLAEMLGPAIRLAGGFPVSDELAAGLDRVRDLVAGDVIALDAFAGKLDVLVSATELEARRAVPGRRRALRHGRRRLHRSWANAGAADGRLDCRRSALDQGICARALGPHDLC